MPIYQRTCRRCPHSWETLKRVGRRHDPEPCPLCGGESGLGVVGFSLKVDGPRQTPPRGREAVHRRHGGGASVLNRETGGYRPAITHRTRCIKEGKDRNVAILSSLPEGLSLNCEVCGYQWIYQEATAEYPLVEGVREDYRKGTSFHMNESGMRNPRGDPKNEYEKPERA